MINAEKFRKELLKVINENEQDFIAFDDRDNSIKNCTTMVCKNCKFSRTKAKVLCTQTKLKWLLSEYKEPVKLSRLEYEILKYLFNDTGYRYIARNKYRHEGGVYNLYIFKDEPFEDSGVWCSGRDSGNEFYVFNNLFAFVKWEDSKPTSIKDVLENCEVVDDDNES